MGTNFALSSPLQVFPLTPSAKPGTPFPAGASFTTAILPGIDGSALIKSS